MTILKNSQTGTTHEQFRKIYIKKTTNQNFQLNDTQADIHKPLFNV
jgi:hypothetical protein